MAEAGGADSVPLQPLMLVDVATGRSFELGDRSEVSIGRADQRRGVRPDVDLGPVDAGRSVSRRHARLLRAEGRSSVVQDRETTNGTYVNGMRIPVGREVPVREGDLIWFGTVVCRLEQSSNDLRTKPASAPTREAEGDTAPVIQLEHEPETAKPLAMRITAPAVAFGFNEDLELDGTVLHAQTEDLGDEIGAVLTVVYRSGAVVYSRRTTYRQLREVRGGDLTPAQMVRLQHRSIVLGLRSGRLTLKQGGAGDA